MAEENKKTLQGRGKNAFSIGLDLSRAVFSRNSRDLRSHAPQHAGATNYATPPLQRAHPAQPTQPLCLMLPAPCDSNYRSARCRRLEGLRLHTFRPFQIGECKAQGSSAMRRRVNTLLRRTSPDSTSSRLLDSFPMFLIRSINTCFASFSLPARA